MAGSLPPGCPIRKSAHQWVFAPTRGLSQLVTSFVASESPGILHAPFSPFLVTFAELFQAFAREIVLLSFLSLQFMNFYLLVFASKISMCSFLPLRGGVENNGFEPLTPCLQSRCSSQLS